MLFLNNTNSSYNTFSLTLNLKEIKMIEYDKNVEKYGYEIVDKTKENEFKRYNLIKNNKQILPRDYKFICIVTSNGKPYAIFAQNVKSKTLEDKYLYNLNGELIINNYFSDFEVDVKDNTLIISGINMNCTDAEQER